MYPKLHSVTHGDFVKATDTGPTTEPLGLVSDRDAIAHLCVVPSADSCAMGYTTASRVIHLGYTDLLGWVSCHKEEPTPSWIPD
jgi:hypothetical protein